MILEAMTMSAALGVAFQIATSNFETYVGYGSSIPVDDNTMLFTAIKCAVLAYLFPFKPILKTIIGLIVSYSAYKYLQVPQ
jgi:hypothetical protein